MVITLTPLTKAQWIKVGVVILWIGVSFAASAIVAAIASNSNYLALTPLINILLVTIKQVASQEETAALNGLPVATQAELEAAQQAAVQPPAISH